MGKSREKAIYQGLYEIPKRENRVVFPKWENHTKG